MGTSERHIIHKKNRETVSEIHGLLPNMVPSYEEVTQNGCETLPAVELSGRKWTRGGGALSCGFGRHGCFGAALLKHYSLAHPYKLKSVKT